MSVNPLQSTIAFHIETSNLIFNAYQMTGFYVKCNVGLEMLTLYILTVHMCSTE